MSSDPETRTAFATFRVVGDQLQPDEISHILRTVPTRAGRKGEQLQRGPRSPKTTERTGIWFFSTDSVVLSDRLEDHVAYLLGMILPRPGDGDPLSALQNVLRKKRLTAHFTLFWHGSLGAKKPSVPSSALDIFKLLPADVEIDFDADEESPRRRRAPVPSRP